MLLTNVGTVSAAFPHIGVAVPDDSGANCKGRSGSPERLKNLPVPPNSLTLGARLASAPGLLGLCCVFEQQSSHVAHHLFHNTAHVLT